MLFNSAAYGVFLAITYAVFWLLRRMHAARTIFLVVASYVFYFYGTYDAAVDEDIPLGPFGWSAMCLSIIFVGSSLDYFIGKKLARTEDKGSRRALLLVSIVYYLGVLSIFKYANFAAESFAAVLRAMHVDVSAPRLRVVLPFGISFFTFETMSYTIDVYRREIEPAKSYKEYLLFVCFFPHLVAGPIVRPRQMLPQLARPPVASDAMRAQGLYLIATGLAKKMIIGDTLAVDFVGRVFDNPERYSSLEVLVAVYAYAVQIYADFSGYTDVAIGSGYLFGYELPQNFDAPYISRNLQEFWRRWHISLSTWLRDYLYVPLGGSRKGTWSTYRNLMITMVLGGLWHGASFNFVIWGTLHGGALAVNRMWQRARSPRSTETNAQIPGIFTHILCVFCTFHFVCFAWIFFRAPTLGHAVLMLQRMTHLTHTTPNLSVKVVALVLVALVLHFVPKRFELELRNAFTRVPAAVQGAILAGFAVALHFAASQKAAPFVYGQF